MRRQIFVFLLAFFSGIHIDFACSFQGLGAKYLLAGNYAGNNQYETALQILGGLSTQDGFNAVEHARYMDIFMLRKAVYQSNRILSQLTEAEKDTLYNMRDGLGRAYSVLANNILCFWYGDCEELVIPLPESISQLRQAPQSAATILNSLNSVKVYPNPAHGFTTFSYQLQKETKASLTIYDLTGKVISSFLINEQKGDILWDTRSHSNGMYIYELSIGTEKIATGKVTVEN